MGRLATLCVVFVALAAACGGGGTTGASSNVPSTPAAVKRCLEEGAAEMRVGPPLAPKGSGVHAFYAIGPGGRHVAVVLTPSVAEADRITAELAKEKEWAPRRAPHDRTTLVLVDFRADPAEEKLGERCAEA